MHKIFEALDQKCFVFWGGEDFKSQHTLRVFLPSWLREKRIQCQKHAKQVFFSFWDFEDRLLSAAALLLQFTLKKTRIASLKYESHKPNNSSDIFDNEQVNLVVQK